MKRLAYLVLACLIATSLSSCALVGSLLQTIGRVPGSLLKSVTSVDEPGGEDPERLEGEPVPGQPDGRRDAASPEAVIVVTPID